MRFIMDGPINVSCINHGQVSVCLLFCRIPSSTFFIYNRIHFVVYESTITWDSLGLITFVDFSTNVHVCKLFGPGTLKGYRVVLELKEKPKWIHRKCSNTQDILGFILQKHWWTILLKLQSSSFQKVTSDFVKNQKWMMICGWRRHGFKIPQQI